MGWGVFAVLAVALFGLFHATATVLGSDRGQYGVVVALVVVSALLACERMLSGRPLSDCAARLGLGAPRPRGFVLAAGIAVLLLVFVPLSLGIVGARAALLDGWKGSLIGLFAQAGIAEEALFRGFLFRRLRPGRSFRRAVVLSSGPYLVAHLPLFGSLPWPYAAAALGLAAATSVSLARLFESGGWTIWPPAVLHFVVQGTVKVLALDELPPSFPVLWMMASAVLPLLVLLDDGTPGPVLSFESRPAGIGAMRVLHPATPTSAATIRSGPVVLVEMEAVEHAVQQRREQQSDRDQEDHAREDRVGAREELRAIVRQRVDRAHAGQDHRGVE